MMQCWIGRLAGVAAGTALLCGLLALPASADLNVDIGDTATVAYTAGDGVNVRTAPNRSADIRTTLPEGWVVTIVSGPETDDNDARWYEISTETELGAIIGWVSADYLSHVNVIADEQQALNGATIAYVAADGDGLNLREGPSLEHAIISGIPDGTAVSILSQGFVDEFGIRWSMVSYDGIVGYSAAMFLVEAPATSTSQTLETDAFGTLSSGNTAEVSGTDGGGVMLRAEPRIDAGAVSSVFEGVEVAILSDPVVDAQGNSWYMATVDGVTGWVHSAYLTRGSAVPTVQSSTLGDLFVSEALAYLGTAYVWAGSEPGGFDCSGFTYYIVNLVTGGTFPRAIEEQIASGVAVPYDELQPGDLVFFENTYTEGLSHVGFYLGNGQFISATAEFDAVGISNLNDPYWSARYLTARRLA